jgi:hypothetical protein
MKRYLWLPLLTVAIIGWTATAKAQSTYGVRANVPFEFNVGDKTLPAGPISVREMSVTNSGALAISNVNRGRHVIRIAHGLTSSRQISQGKLVFLKYGNRYHLTQIWIPGCDPLELNKSKKERALERDTLLSKASTPQLVTIMADLQ